MKRAGVILAAWLSLSAAATSVLGDSVSFAMASPWQERAANQLAGYPDPDALVTAAALYGIPPSTPPDPAHVQDALHDVQKRTMQWLQRAQRFDPSSADIAALAVLQCHDASVCDVHALSAHLKTLAPGNAFVALPDLRLAVKARQTDAVTRILQSMAQARAFDTYWPALLQRMQSGLQLAWPDPDTGHALFWSQKTKRAAAVFWLAPKADFWTLLTACDPARAVFGRRRDACRKIGLLLENSETLDGNQIGGILHYRAARDARDRAWAHAYLRRLDWLHVQYQIAYQSGAPTGQNYLRAVLAQHGEIAGIRVLLREKHVATSPPATWKDSTLDTMLAGDRKHPLGSSVQHHGSVHEG